MTASDQLIGELVKAAATIFETVLRDGRRLKGGNGPDRFDPRALGLHEAAEDAAQVAIMMCKQIREGVDE